jgi:hypothetical protein
VDYGRTWFTMDSQHAMDGVLTGRSGAWFLAARALEERGDRGGLHRG